MHDVQDILSDTNELNVCWLYVLFSFSSKDPPNEPVVEAPAKPPLSDDEDEVEDDQLDEAHYDSLEKASTPTGDYWALPPFKPAVGGSPVRNCTISH